MSAMLLNMRHAPVACSKPCNAPKCLPVATRRMRLASRKASIYEGSSIFSSAVGIQVVPRSRAALQTVCAKKYVGDLSKSDLEGKTVLVRADLNVPLDKNQKITDDTRIRAAVPTLKYLVSNGAKVLLTSHLVRQGRGLQDRGHAHCMRWHQPVCLQWAMHDGCMRELFVMLPSKDLNVSLKYILVLLPASLRVTPPVAGANEHL